MPVTIDPHHHYWELGRFDYSWLDEPTLAAIRRSFLPPDLEPLIREAGIDKTIFVQTQHNLEETEWVLGLADQHDFMAGVVGWVDLASDQCEEQLLRLKEHPKFSGIRHVTQDEPDNDFIIRPDILRGLQVLEKHQVPFDLLFYVNHVHHAATVAAAVPELPLVIDHLSKPEIKARRLDNWQNHFRRAAEFPNVYCKLSGMITEANWQHWTIDDLKPYVDIALEAFGPDRCMFGSDWPVCELAGTYAEVYQGLRELLEPLSDHEQQLIFGGTATRFYQLTL